LGYNGGEGFEDVLGVGSDAVGLVFEFGADDAAGVEDERGWEGLVFAGRSTAAGVPEAKLVRDEETGVAEDDEAEAKLLLEFPVLGGRIRGDADDVGAKASDV
jgi:hypothetical protein